MTIFSIADLKLLSAIGIWDLDQTFKIFSLCEFIVNGLYKIQVAERGHSFYFFSVIILNKNYIFLVSSVEGRELSLTKLTRGDSGNQIYKFKIALLRSLGGGSRSVFVNLSNLL